MESQAATTPDVTRRVARILRSRAFAIQVGVAGVLGVFFVVAAVAGNQGRIGGRSVRLLQPTVPVMAPIKVDLHKKYDPRGEYLEWGRGRNPWTLDSHGIPIVNYGPTIGVRHNPVTTAQYGLWRWDRWLMRHDGTDLAAARTQANWLVAHQDSRTGAWIYTIPLPAYHLKGSWPSALAQGQAMSLLTRVWVHTHDRKYLRAAEKALKPLEVRVSRGGVRASLDGHPWYEEYPSRPPSFVLNGFMFTLVGLHDVREALPHSAAGRLYRQGMRTLVYGLPQFDAGGGAQYYDLQPKRWPGFPKQYASVGYMQTHVVLLQALNSIIPSRVLRHYLLRWAAGTVPRPKRVAVGRRVGRIPRMAALHVNVHQRYTPSRSYPVLVGTRNIWTLDSHGIPIVDYGPTLGTHHNPVTTAQYGLWRWNRWLTRHHSTDLAAARKQANWLVAHQEPGTGKWVYHFPLPTYRLKAPWSSALAQGQSISLLTRMWRRTHDRFYLSAAEKAVKPFERPVEQGGLVASLDGHPWYEEVPSRRPSFILNGMMFTLLGLHDLNVAVPKSPAGREAGLLYRTGIRSLAFGLPQYDAGKGAQYYDLRPLRWPNFPKQYASISYMRVDVQLLEALNSISPNPRLLRYLHKWAAGTIHPATG